MILENIKDRTPLSEGRHYEVHLVETHDGQKFVQKRMLNKISGFLLQEAKGLRALRDSGKINIPKILEASEESLVLEYIASSEKTESFWLQLGKSLAELHQNKITQLGLDTDNFIGLTPQKNTPFKHFESSKDWVNFFWDYRIEFQLALLKSRKPPEDLYQKFASIKDAVLKSLSVSNEEPCLLHGDLWGGNILCSQEQKPYLIDPAIYYGHREADLALTQLFGGFHYLFYESYQKTYPLKPGWPERFKIYQLYHLLNHWNLFGDSYSNQVYSILQKLPSR